VSRASRVTPSRDPTRYAVRLVFEPPIRSLMVRRVKDPLRDGAKRTWLHYAHLGQLCSSKPSFRAGTPSADAKSPMYSSFGNRPEAVTREVADTSRSATSWVGGSKPSISAGFGRRLRRCSCPSCAIRERHSRELPRRIVCNRGRIGTRSYSRPPRPRFRP
jgi:hypothetical protein